MQQQLQEMQSEKIKEEDTLRAKIQQQEEQIEELAVQYRVLKKRATIASIESKYNQT